MSWLRLPGIEAAIPTPIHDENGNLIELTIDCRATTAVYDICCLAQKLVSNGTYRIKTVGEAWDIVHAGATDHANRIMRAAGRKRWSDGDADAYVERLYQLLRAFGFWRDDAPTNLYFAMRADRSAPFIIAEV